MSDHLTFRHSLLFSLSGFGIFALHDALIKSLTGYATAQILFFAVLFSYVPFSFVLATDRRERTLRPVRMGWVILRAGCMVGAGLFAFFAFQTLPLAQAYALLFAMPILVTVLAVPILGERIRLARGLAIVIGLCGIIVVLRPGAAPFGLGHLAALAATLCSAFSGVITRKIAATEHSATLILYPLLAKVLVSGALLAFFYQPMPLLDLGKMAAIGILAIAGQYLIIRAYRIAPAALVAPFQYSQMLWAILYGYIWFGEIPDRYVALGSVIIIAAGLLIVWRESTSGVSQNRPFLQTRNVRAVAAPPMQSAERDAADETG